jgi:ZIP family zinc transporter
MAKKTDGVRESEDSRARRSAKRSDGGQTVTRNGFSLPTWAGALLPVVLLVAVIGGFVLLDPFSGVESGAALPDVTVTHATMPNEELVVLHVTNNGPEPVTISQVQMNDAYWQWSAVKGGEAVNGPVTLGPAESAAIHVPYHWNPTWDLHAGLVLSDGTTVHHTIVAPSETPGVSTNVLWTLALVGLFVGVIPVALGMLWFPVMQELSDTALHAILAFSVGVLAFLAFDAGFEAFEVAEQVPGVFEGTLLVVVGIVGTLLLVQSVGEWHSGGGETTGLTLAYLVALGIGLHNLAEGLAIGGAFALGRVALGAFLVLGFMVHNVTEGPAVVAPVARGERPALKHFVALGLLAGAPIILGGWLGSFAQAPALGALALAAGVGAILQVNWEIGSMIRRRGRLATAPNMLAFLGGLVVMYATDLFVAL